MNRRAFPTLLSTWKVIANGWTGHMNLGLDGKDTNHDFGFEGTLFGDSSIEGTWTAAEGKLAFVRKHPSFKDQSYEGWAFSQRPDGPGEWWWHEPNEQRPEEYWWIAGVFYDQGFPSGWFAQGNPQFL